MKLRDHFEGFENWVAAEPKNLNAPQIPDPETRSTPYSRATLPLSIQYTGDTVKQYIRPELSSFRMWPIIPSGHAANNSQSANVVTTITGITTPVSSGGSSGTGGGSSSTTAQLFQVNGNPPLLAVGLINGIPA